VRRRRGLYLGLAATWFVLAALVASTHGRGARPALRSGGVLPYVLTQCKAIVHYLRLASGRIVSSSIMGRAGPASGRRASAIPVHRSAADRRAVALRRRHGSGFWPSVFLPCSRRARVFFPSPRSRWRSIACICPWPRFQSWWSRGLCRMTRLTPRFARSGFARWAWRGPVPGCCNRAAQPRLSKRDRPVDDTVRKGPGIHGRTMTSRRLSCRRGAGEGRRGIRRGGAGGSGLRTPNTTWA